MNLNKLAIAALCTMSSLSHAQLSCNIGTVNSWNSGFTVQDIEVTNNGNATVNSWTVDLEFDVPVDITNSWSSTLSNTSGRTITVSGVGYNSQLASGEKASFGMNGDLNRKLRADEVRCVPRGGSSPTPVPTPAPTATPTPAPTATPVPSNQAAIPGRIEVEDYETYNDTTTGNAGGQYRTDDVDIQVTSDSGGGYNVGWIASGESLSFPVRVNQDGRYRITLRVASRSAGGNIAVSLNGNPLGSNVAFDATGGWQTWRNERYEADLTAGNKTLKLDFLSSSFNINYIEFEWLSAGPTPTPTPPPTATPVPTQPPTGSNNDDWLHTNGNQILDRNNNAVWLTGTNWFGFNTGTNAFDGLWSVNLEQAMQAMAERGINLLRVPISTELVYQWSNGTFPTSSSLNTYVNPDLAGKHSLEIFDRMLDVARDNGMKVMVDFHSALTNASGHIAPMWYDGYITTEIFYESWEWLARRYKDNDTIVAFDLENEPHGKPWQNGDYARWDNSSHRNNWKAVAEEAGRRVLAIHPNVLIMVEGIESTPKPGKTYGSNNEADYDNNWWGGNLRGVKNAPVNLGSGQNRLVYSPHDYGPLVYKQPWFDKNFNKATLYNDVWRDNWAYIMEDDIAPLLIGEWGGFMDGADNQKWMQAIADYILENKIHHTFWCFNANSGDTGGLVENDFVTWDEEKYNLLKPTLWQTPGGKFVGLDHEIPLGGSKGITVTEYYNRGLAPPVR